MEPMETGNQDQNPQSLKVHEPPIDPLDGFDWGIEVGEIDDQTYVCFTCKELKPATAFEIRKEDDLPRKNCIECEASYGRRSNKRRKKEKIASDIHRLVAAATKKRVDLPAIDAICSEMFDQYDGPKGFAQEWKNDIDAAKIGSKAKLDQYGAIWKMAVAANADRKEDLDWSTVSETDIEEAVSRYAYRVLRPDEDESTNEQPNAECSGA